MSRAVLIPVVLYVAVTLVSPIVRGTVKGPIGDHALIVVGVAALTLLSSRLREACTTKRRGSQ
jgi:hypothetical protein